MSVVATLGHEGELKLRQILSNPYDGNPNSPSLTPFGERILQIAPVLAISTVDAQNRPWTSLWGGEPGFVCSLGSSMVGLKTLVDAKFDPVVEALLDGGGGGGGGQDAEKGKTLSALAISLDARKRVKFAGRVVAGAKKVPDEEMKAVGEAQVIIKVDSSLGNCPKYLNRKVIRPILPNPQLVSSTLPLPPAAVSLLNNADNFFISASFASSLSTNYRGGPPGFVRLLSNTASSVRIAYPEYSGNRLYQTLGNLIMAPEAGIVIPDFDTGDVLYMTTKGEILIGKDASDLIPHSNLVIVFDVLDARFVQNGLAFRGEKGEFSPYNPKVRYLRTEKSALEPKAETGATAKLLAKETLTPSIARFRFAISDPAKTEKAKQRWTAGQHVALSFEQELDLGYSHMRDDDPRSLNDDYTRTFTVSSPPGSLANDDEFEVTIRNVGKVTDFMFKSNVRAGLDIPLKGFGGEFVIQMGIGDGMVPFVAGGIGITPVLGQISSLDLKRFRLWWTVGVGDLGLVRDTFDRCPGLPGVTRLFVTGIRKAEGVGVEERGIMDGFEAKGAKVYSERITEEVIREGGTDAERWYVCSGKPLRQSLIGWLPGKEVVFEDFDY